MNIQYNCAPGDLRGMDTETLRRRFLVQNLFAPDRINLTYSHIDRMVVGGVRPVAGPVVLGETHGKAIGVPYFLKRREMGIINVGGPGHVKADGARLPLNTLDGAYLGCETEAVSFHSDNASRPAKFYLNSSPAFVKIPAAVVRKDQAVPTTLGDEYRANVRTIHQYIHPEVQKANFLLMGVTVPAPNSVWNTMPCHTHERRMEAYFYFDMAEDQPIFHFMGKPEETRHLVVNKDEALFCPSWSVHFGAGTGPYKFIWGMTGENQEYWEMDFLSMRDVR
ncbi:MAG: 5-dehydro-4-deoxy-D-glucuronate isomerase [Rhodobacteraceae bacterium]|nr:5-dehydro-4-deoxy-D-glucuronate isomerase [Paracoccaceae bacterium]